MHLTPFNALFLPCLLLHEAAKTTMGCSLVTLPTILMQKSQAISKINYPDLWDRVYDQILHPGAYTWYQIPPLPLGLTLIGALRLLNRGLQPETGDFLITKDLPETSCLCKFILLCNFKELSVVIINTNQRLCCFMYILWDQSCNSKKTH